MRRICLNYPGNGFVVDGNVTTDADSECIEMESMRLGLSLEAILSLFSVVQNGDEQQEQKAD